MNTINYVYQTTAEMMINYFNIIGEENIQLLELINKQTIQSSQYFPVYGFSTINHDIQKISILKENQKNKIKDFLGNLHENCMGIHNSIQEILDDTTIPKSNRINCIVYSILKHNISLENTEKHLRAFENKKSTDYRKTLCAYNYMKYSEEC